jgi:hypothetical protein
VISRSGAAADEINDRPWWAVDAHDNEGEQMTIRRFRLGAFALAAATALAAVGVGTATAGPPFKQPPRGNDQAEVSGCLSEVTPLTVGDTCVAAYIQVPASTGEALVNGQFEITVPAGTTLTGTVLDAANFGTNNCTWDGSSSVSGQTIVVSNLSCPQDSAFVVFFDGSVASTPGTYTLEGDYKVNNTRRTNVNVFRYAQDPTTTVVSGA